jgi:hypothetical protein
VSRTWLDNIEDATIKAILADYKPPVVSARVYETLRCAARDHHFDANLSAYRIEEGLQPETVLIRTDDGVILWERGQ